MEQIIEDGLTNARRAKRDGLIVIASSGLVGGFFGSILWGSPLMLVVLLYVIPMAIGFRLRSNGIRWEREWLDDLARRWVLRIDSLMEWERCSVNNLARLRQEADRWARKLDAHQVKTTADWHLYQRAMTEYRDALDAHFKTTANAAD